jgi:serine phosphatase RsbU (regulator of sigma subunit)
VLLCIIIITVKQEALSSSLSFRLLNGGASGYERQIIEQILTLIRAREIVPGEPLPSPRQLASELLVSPGTVRRAYARLEAEGLIVRRPDDSPAIVRDADDVLYQRTLDRSRGELAHVLSRIRRLAPTDRDRLEIEAEHIRRAIEIDQARAMQRSLLPRTPPTIADLDIAVSMITASEVGGDYYDFLEKPGNGLRAVIGDATGHGLTAGIMAAMTKACLTAIRAEATTAMMKKANQVLRGIRGTRVLMSLGILDVEGGQATICSAGMPPVFVLRGESGRVEEVLLPSLPLGSSLADTFPCRRVPFGPLDALVAVSDGLPEIRNFRGEALGSAPLCSWLAKHAAATARDIVDGLNQLASDWSADGSPEDDLTVLVIKRRKEEHP